MLNLPCERLENLQLSLVSCPLLTVTLQKNVGIYSSFQYTCKSHVYVLFFGGIF